ncbi:unnamed protein product [Rotaria socialis]|uniref:Uncharacterized protein n=1 Tax=Rotaria socialis TaxID=392032 RepID=A0A817Q6W6_9BILA|nr:unnamed protein product [Rotaria socialis]CAF3186225.1 unnamed protein product [Rotaria socialis]CAF3381654.1 unnamed protein product [Rotaria socialis]CAF3673728.1 unnamed protein product [Rotaria socialis]CAF4526036.1 unnamed protein product [Rotaria socialis]
MFKIVFFLFDELNQESIIDDYDDDELNIGRLNSEYFLGDFKSSNDQRKLQTKQKWVDHMIESAKLDEYERQHENKRKSKAHVDTANKVNPFDLDVNPCRHGVLDKRCSYAKCGQPLKSPSRCVEKRKRTLLKELNSLLIRNTLIDNCLDENDATLAR